MGGGGGGGGWREGTRGVEEREGRGSEDITRPVGRASPQQGS